MVLELEKQIRCQSLNISLPEDLIAYIDQAQSDRGDPHRSDTFRFLLNLAFGTLSYLPDERKKAYNL